MDKYKVSLFHVLLSIDFCVLLIALILCVIFGQVTVRKLRKNPVTKDALGIEFVSGWDIFNVAMALTLPKKYALWRKGAALGMLHADANLLYKHTTRMDRVLARIFYILCALAVFFLLVLFLMQDFGFF